MQTAGITPRGVIVAVDRAFDRYRIGPKPPSGAPACPYRHANAERVEKGRAEKCREGWTLARAQGPCVVPSRL